jgi:hypothetical protein
MTRLCQGYFEVLREQAATQLITKVLTEGGKENKIPILAQYRPPSWLPLLPSVSSY